LRFEKEAKAAIQELKELKKMAKANAAAGAILSPLKSATTK
jgi:hypothetical protein